ncbi:MAG: hypothetical protein SO532_03960 [Candidatus Borkfalkiaceae bacterium]|nr:hypothetical protein [Christensenellaceae bacterium]
MRFRNSIRLLMENFGNVYKMLLYKLVVGIIFAALSAALIVPQLMSILESTEWLNFIADLKEFFKAVAGGDIVYLENFNSSFTGEGGTVEALLLLLKERIPSLVWALLGVVLVYLLKRIADTLCHYTAGSVLNDRLSTFSETPFTGSFVKNFGRAWSYSIVYVPLMFLYNALMIGLCYFLFFYLLELLSFQPLILSLFLTVTFIVLAEAFKMTLTGLWLPSMTTGGETIGKAMKIKGKINSMQFKRIFASYVASVYMIIFINVGGAICTVGSLLLLTIPASYFFLICVQYVNYYTVTGRRYFLAYDRVFDDPSRGDSAHYLDAVGEAEAREAAESGETAETNGGEAVNERMKNVKAQNEQTAGEKAEIGKTESEKTENVGTDKAE